MAVVLKLSKADAVRVQLALEWLADQSIRDDVRAPDAVTLGVLRRVASYIETVIGAGS